MNRWIKLFCLLAFPCMPVLADTLTWTGHSIPVFGGQEDFDIFSVSLTFPNGGNQFTLSIATDYEVTIPNGATSIPNGSYNGFTSGPHGNFDIGDFLISWHGSFYGVAFSSHDGLTAGDFYQVPGFLTSADVMNIPPGQEISPRPSIPVWLSGSPTFTGLGAFTVTATGADGIGGAKYIINETFNAPAGFLLNDGFTIDMSSFVCANGFLTGDGDLTPEPASVLLLAPFGFLFAWYAFKNRRAQQPVPVRID